MPNTTQQRVYWIDSARVIAILLVAMAHSPFGFLFNHNLEAGAVALFFLLSGYFTKKKSLQDTLKRALSLCAFYVCWSFFGLIVSCHGFHFTLSTVLRVLTHGNVNAMWFILYLLYFTLIGFIFTRLPFYLRSIITIGLLIGGTWSCMEHPPLHPSANFSLALALFCMGQLASKMTPSTCGNLLFGKGSKRAQRCAPFIVLSAILTASAFHFTLIPAWILIFPAMWAILGSAYSLDQFAPRFSKTLAAVGVSVVFIYGFHSSTLRVLVSAYLHTFGTLPSYFVSALFIFALIAGGFAVYRLLIGKSRILDAFLFAR